MTEEKTKILLAEDDKNLGTILKSYLSAKGYETSLYINGDEAFKAYKKEAFDFCIIDIMMPVKDGFTLAGEIRAENKSMPILFLTAKSMHQDKLKGFDLGADDYLTKPFNMDELLARIKAILRRAGSHDDKSENQIFKIGEYTFDHNRQLLIHNKNEQKLTSRESELLFLLSKNANQVLDRREALKEIWLDDSYFNARSMDVYIAKLRKYLNKDPAVELINVHGIGFKLVIPDK